MILSSLLSASALSLKRDPDYSLTFLGAGVGDCGGPSSLLGEGWVGIIERS